MSAEQSPVCKGRINSQPMQTPGFSKVDIACDAGGCQVIKNVFAGPTTITEEGQQNKINACPVRSIYSK